MAEIIDNETGEIKIAPYVPDEDEFDGADFMEASGLASIGRDLILSMPEFSNFQEAKIRYYWKRAGGKSQGQDKMGACQKPSGLLSFVMHCDFVIWLAADHVRSWAMQDRLEPLLYHELSHMGFDIDEGTGDVTYRVVGHEFEGFTGEIERWGFWKDGLRRVELTVDQYNQGRLAL